MLSTMRPSAGKPQAALVGFEAGVGVAVGLFWAKAGAAKQDSKRISSRHRMGKHLLRGSIES